MKYMTLKNRQASPDKVERIAAGFMRGRDFWVAVQKASRDKSLNAHNGPII